MATRLRQLISSREAVPAKGQHTQPCSDCPWARTAFPGWLGGSTPEEWVQAAHGESLIDCHAIIGAQCAGAAIYRANVAKLCRSANMLRLSSDKQKVFANPTEFMHHHQRSKQMAISKTLKASLEKKTIDKIDEAKGEVEELLQDLRNKFDDKSEKWQQGDKGEALSDQITNIGEAMDDLDGAMDKLRNFRDSD